MPIWFDESPLATATSRHRDTIVNHIGIEITEAGDDWLKGRMPVDRRTVQPMGIVHGGASCVLAETLASWAATYCVDRSRYRCVGLEINANHVRPGTGAWVTGIARPIHVGRTTQIWDVRITDEQEKLVCVSRVTMAVLERTEPA
jgi:1,4-dihydroxy-2-naphthoyl-CoA hydrolase